jgi:Fe-S-cluster containining protein
MNFSDIFPAELEGSSIEVDLKALHGLYEEVEAETSAFCGAVREKLLADADRAEEASPRFGCPPGCGACCERFVPDILPLEAEYAALWILRYRPELAAVEFHGEAGCPYYRKDKPEAHCSIYQGRPLICRLFGYSGVGTKRGSLAYSLCWSMPEPTASSSRSWEGEGLMSALGARPPLMADFGLRLQALSPDSPHEKPLIEGAIAEAIARISFMKSLAAAGGTD